MEYHEFQFCLLSRLSVASLSHSASSHCSCICMAQVPCLVTFVFCASFHPHVIHVCLTADWHLDCTRVDPFWFSSFDMVAELTLIW